MNWRRPPYPAATTHRRASRLAFAAGLVVLAGCEGKLAKLTDTELQDRTYECNTNLDQSPGMAISCDNYRRECKRRRGEGRFVC